MSFRSQFRDIKEWSRSTSGCINLNTTSDEAAKQYDASVTQLCGWYDDESLGGLEGTLDKMLKADQDFVLGRALELQLNLMGGLTAPRLDSDLANRLAEFNKLTERRQANKSLNDHEALHAEVVNCWARCDLKQSALVLEKIITSYPDDIVAVKLAQDTYFYLGQALGMRNSASYCLSNLTRSDRSGSNPLQGYVHGMYGFALEESNMYPQAKLQALKAVEMNPRDAWAIHCYTHCLEMLNKTEAGLKWMLDKKPDWETCSGLACHLNWHTALFQINSSNYAEAVAILDEEVLPRCVASTSSLDLHDGASLVYRMELANLFEKTGKLETGTVAGGKEGDQVVGNRWSGLYDICKPHKRDHLIGFNDAHFMMSYLGAGDLNMARELIETVDEVPSLNEGQTVVKPLLEAMYKYKLGAYSECVELLEPIRFDLVKMGGSHAQRDVFEQLLIVAALKSDKLEHNKLAQRILEERDFFNGSRNSQTELLATAV